MPIYEYVCKECGHVHELFKKFVNANNETGTACPVCGGDSTRKVSSVAFKKGDGYWADQK